MTRPAPLDATKRARPTGWQCGCHNTTWVLTPGRAGNVIVSTGPAAPEIHPDLGALIETHSPLTVCGVDNVAALWAEKTILEFRLILLEDKARKPAETTTAFPEAEPDHATRDTP